MENQPKEHDHTGTEPQLDLNAETPDLAFATAQQLQRLQARVRQLETLADFAKLWEWVKRFDGEVRELQTNAKHLKGNTENHLLAHDRQIGLLQDRQRQLEQGGSTFDNLTTQQYVGMLDSAEDDVVTAEMKRYAAARKDAGEQGLSEPTSGRFSEASKVNALLTEHLSRVG